MKDYAEWNKITNAKWKAKTSEALDKSRYETALDLAKKLSMKNPMDDDESEASARKILVDNKALFSTIEKKRHGLYVALCTQKKTNPTELKEIGWDHVSLGDFDFNCEAKHVEKTLHRLLQHRF